MAVRKNSKKPNKEINSNLKRLWHDGFSEGLGTFLLVFFGSSAVIINQGAFGIYEIGNIGVSLVFGFSIIFIMFVTRPISGGHINPAISFAMLLLKEISVSRAGVYIFCQFIGAIIAVLLAKMILPVYDQTLGAPHIHVSASYLSAYFIESIATATLVFVFCTMALNKNTPTPMLVIAVGAVFLVSGIVFRDFTGAALNPAYALGASFVRLEILDSWVYILSAITGSIVGIIFYVLLLGKKAIK